MTSPAGSSSPRWSNTLKLIIGLTFAGLIFALLIYLRSLIGPLLLVFIITYLLHPVIAILSRTTRLTWRVSVNLVFLLVIIILLSLSTLTGVAVASQVQSLIRVVQNFINDLPTLVNNLASQKYSFGSFELDLSHYLDLNYLGSQLINAIQPLVGRATTLVGTFASGAASLVGWTLFILLVAYFILADIGQVPDTINYIQIPGYDADIRRIAHELGRTWNAFLRGQFILVLLVVLIYSIWLSLLGVRYAMGIALLAGLARFVPYIGPFTTNTVLFLVAFFQGHNYLNIAPLYYALISTGSAILIDQLFDSMVSPRLMGHTLGVHPAAVLIAAIIATNLIGFVGLVLAAPVLASLKLLGQYTFRKMLDLDPWTGPPTARHDIQIPLLGRGIRRVKAWWRARRRV